MKALIVGAGAGGTVTGYHLALSGVDVTFFVRPARIEEMETKPRRLYCYNDNQVKLFSEYETICDLEAIAHGGFDYILTTLDGSAMQSDEGKALFRSLGNAIRQSQTVLVCLGAALNVESIVTEFTGLPLERCLFGSFSLLSHNIPLPDQRFVDSIDQEQLATCDFAYTHLGKGNTGLALTRTNRNLGLKFAEVYDRSGVSSCMVLPNLRIADSMFCFLAPSFVALEIEGWPELEQMYAKENWKLAQKATAEIFALPQHGFLGKVVGAIVGPFNLLTKTWKGMERDASPLDFRAFNKFHHGGKVLQQDLDIARDILAREGSRGRSMPSLQSLVDRLDNISEN
ncbi:MAG: 2-dehydropantoate 2-reductase N-terminal domain-containing protein [Pseudomonadota bacterium]